jgi:hypothetical protein
MLPQASSRAVLSREHGHHRLLLPAAALLAKQRTYCFASAAPCLPHRPEFHDTNTPCETFFMILSGCISSNSDYSSWYEKDSEQNRAVFSNLIRLNKTNLKLGFTGRKCLEGVNSLVYANTYRHIAMSSDCQNNRFNKSKRLICNHFLENSITPIKLNLGLRSPSKGPSCLWTYCFDSKAKTATRQDRRVSLGIHGPYQTA